MKALRTYVDRLGLKWRLILGVSALLLTSSLLLSVFVLDEFSSAALQSSKDRGSALARSLAHNSEFGVMLEIGSDLEALVGGVLTESDVLFAQVLTANGRLLAEGTRHDVRVESVHSLPSDFDHWAEDIKQPNQVHIEILKLPDGREVIEIVAGVHSHESSVSKEELGSPTGSRSGKYGDSKIIGYTRIGMSLEKTKAAIAATRQMVAYFTLLLVMLGILLSVTLVKMLASPINTLVDATERLASGDLSQRVHVTTDAELERLAVAFNTMCDSLEHTQKELEKHNRTLEEKVRERTRRLEEVQQQVIQSEKMAAVGQLAAGVAHELNNPLGGILGYAQFALEKISRGDLASQDVNTFEKYLSDIEVQARRCKMIVKNLLKFSRSSDRSEFTAVDINAALEETFIFTAHQLGMKDIRLHKQLAANLPTVWGNTNLLQQVFTNIIINSMQSMPDGGELTVRTVYNSPVGEFSGAVEISFSDTGTGIPEEIRAKIFEPFFTTKRVGDGTGLGLSVSYGIVRDHGGDIKLDSTVGAGSTFTVVLPIPKERSHSEAGAREIAPVGKKQNVSSR